MRIRLPRRLIAALVALATLVAPAWGSLAARAGPGGRTLLVPVCTTLGAPVQVGISVPGPAPSDRRSVDACQKCVTCAGSADRTHAGALPAQTSIPDCAARGEKPTARPGAAYARAPMRRARAREPPPLA